MMISQYLRTLRCRLQRSALSMLVVGVAAVGVSERTFGEEPLITNVGRFEIPFDIEAEPGQRPEGFAVLFGSQDGGRTWDKLSTVPAVSQSFTFTAPRDGHYSFAIRTTDPQGNLQQPIQGSSPELEVIVDTVAPDVHLELHDGGNGQLLMNWVVKDAAAAIESLNIEYADGTDGRWKSVRFVPAVNGQTAIQTQAAAVVSVRVTVRDQAGNQGETSAQLALRPGGTASNVGPGNSYSTPAAELNSQAIGPSPFPGMTIPPANSVPGSEPFTIPSTQNGTNLPQPQIATDPFPQAGSQPAFHAGSQPSMNFANSNGSTQQSGTYGLPAPGPMKEISYQPVMGAQVIKNHIFDLEYQVDDVGPSGVSAVELYVTEDGGAHWFTYGNDEDLHSPVLIDTRGEGTFGFAVRVRNGLGFADDPPQPGQAPEMVVTVDESLPVIEFAQPTMRTDGFGTIQLSWQIREKNPASTPVRLEYSAAPNGPWTPVFDWQYDQSSYQWGVRPGTPTQMYFRLLARDAAGNVATAQTTQPVVVDLRRPVGRLLRVQPVSHSGIRN